MPNFDRTGPLGKGPGTGRGLGPCAKGQDTPANRAGIGPCGKVRGTGVGRGRGAGRGKGRGRNV